MRPFPDQAADRAGLDDPPWPDAVAAALAVAYFGGFFALVEFALGRFLP